MDFAYWWSFIGRGSGLQPAQQACFLKLDNSVKSIFGKISPKTEPKFVSNNTKFCFKTYPGTQIKKNKNKNSARKKKLKEITVLKKGGGGSARYDHDHRFNVFFYPFS